MDHIEKVREVCKSYRDSLGELKATKPIALGRSRSRAVTISDLHVPFQREDLVEDAIRKYSGAEYCVVNGDLFDCNLISKFPKRKFIPLALEYYTASEIVRLLAQHFGTVILIDGNHEKERFTREMGKLNDSMSFLFKSSPLESIADGERYSPQAEKLPRIELPNVIYAGEGRPVNSWWYRLGGAIFAHRLKGFRKGPMANCVFQAEWFLGRGDDFQCFVTGHTHHQGRIMYKGRILIDQGCLCLPMDYENDGRCTMVPVDLGYAVIEFDKSGNVDDDGTHVVRLGTYQVA